MCRPLANPFQSIYTPCWLSSGLKKVPGTSTFPGSSCSWKPALGAPVPGSESLVWTRGKKKGQGAMPHGRKVNQEIGLPFRDDNGSFNSPGGQKGIRSWETQLQLCPYDIVCWGGGGFFLIPLECYGPYRYCSWQVVVKAGLDRNLCMAVFMTSSVRKGCVAWVWVDTITFQAFLCFGCLFSVKSEPTYGDPVGFSK